MSPKPDMKLYSLKPIETNCTWTMQKICEQMLFNEREYLVISDP